MKGVSGNHCFFLSSSSEGSVCHAGGSQRRENSFLIFANMDSTKLNHRLPKITIARRNSRIAPISFKGIFILLGGEPVHKEVGEGGQLILLRHIDIQ